MMAVFERTALAVALLAAFALADPAPATAQSCSFSIDDVAFGDVTDTAKDITSEFRGTCSGTPGQTVAICPNIGFGGAGAGAGDYRRWPGSGTIALFQLYSDAARSIVWGSAMWGNPQRPPLILATIPSTGTVSFAHTIYGRYPAGQDEVPLGTYYSNFSGTDNATSYKYRDGEPDCASVAGWNLGYLSFNVSAVRPRLCEFSVDDINFGTVPDLSSTVDAQGSIRAKCSPTMGYQIQVSTGNHFDNVTQQRRMSNGTDYVDYGIYTDAGRTSPWLYGNVSGTGTGKTQTFNVYGRVPAQTTPTNGVYTDTIIVYFYY